MQMQKRPDRCIDVTKQYTKLLHWPDLAHACELEPVGSAVLLVKPALAVCEAASDAAFAFWRIRAVEEGDVLVSDVSKPVSR